MHTGDETNCIVCFTCREVGHKSPQCPKRPKDKVKRVLIPDNKIVHLAANDVMSHIADKRVLMTFDTVAQISLFPIELVRNEQFTGEGKFANVTFTMGNDKFCSRAEALSGESIDWTAVLSVNVSDEDLMSKMLRLIRKKRDLPEAETHYLPPHMKEGIIQGAVLVCEGEVVEKESETVLIEPQAHSEEPVVDVTYATVEEVEVGKHENVLVNGVGVSSDDAAEEGDMQGGSADTGVEESVMVETIVSDMPRVKLAQLTKDDPTLAVGRNLEDTQSEGYHWKEGLLFRNRLDEWEVNYDQLCLPNEHRQKCLVLAHEQFGHTGRNKMTGHLCKLFYWPSLTSDVARHCRSCDTCQKFTKQKPSVLPMQEREVVTVPSEWVCVDLVGPFPTAKGGFQFLLTYIDMATRWPEAIPLWKATTRIVIDQLKSIFCRNGFPLTIVTDNGPQFTSELFRKFLREKGIQHVKSSQYYPQGNGVFERMHGTLNSVISRSADKKGNWAEIVPMCLYFLRCTPNRSAGISPFLLKHGLEPVTPLQLLYKGWVQSDLGEVDLEQWVVNNSERVQRLLDKAVVNLKECSLLCKEKWDEKAKVREFKKGDKVLMRRSGMNTKLSESWLGPFEVVRKNSAPSYKINRS